MVHISAPIHILYLHKGWVFLFKKYTQSEIYAGIKGNESFIVLREVDYL